MMLKWLRTGITGAGVALMLGLSACSNLQIQGEGLWRNDLNDAVVSRVVRGATAEQVEAILGKPYQRMPFERTETLAWDYRYKDTWGYWVELSVIFNDNGRVLSLIRQRIESAKDE